jgi:hypothetical protein
MTVTTKERLTLSRIFTFWSPLAAQWLMMAVEWPFLTAVVARLQDPMDNLAAWGVAIAIALIVEAPVIMIMSASTALARDWQSFKRLRAFIYALIVALTLLMVVFVFTPACDFVTGRLIGLPPHIAQITRTTLIFLLPWPGAIGYRRFYHGVLIRDHQTRRVAASTVVRMVTMASVSLVVYWWVPIKGAYAGALAASAAVLLEAVASRILARHAIRRLREDNQPVSEASVPLTQRGILKFYSPLALMSTLGLVVHPMVTFFVGGSRFALESLAVIPVVNALLFLFRAPGFSYQEVAIALIGEGRENFGVVGRFGALVALVATAGLCAIVWTPAAGLWFEGVAGLSPELAAFAIPPARILMLYPILTVVNAIERALLVSANRTGPTGPGTIVEVLVVAGVLTLAIDLGDMVGAVAAALALFAGRLGGCLYLVPACLKVIRKYR